eukprot:c19877_g1_i3.p1 GENE.c19877_g1_i3~~c19877_g1_i3.p1  ORF type:complete len:288 (-),score=106.22 c19877_g1_i3:34-858(-)
MNNPNPYSIGYHNIIAALLHGKSECDKSVFCLVNPATISLFQYAQRIGQGMYASDSAYVVAAALFVRLCQYHPNILGPQSSHKLMVGVIVASAKCTDDAFYSNDYYAEVAGMKREELNLLELEVLHLLDCDMFVTTQQYEQTLKWVKDPSIQSIYRHVLHFLSASKKPKIRIFSIVENDDDILTGREIEKEHYEEEEEDEELHRSVEKKSKLNSGDSLCRSTATTTDNIRLQKSDTILPSSFQVRDYCMTPATPHLALLPVPKSSEPLESISLW